MRHRGIVLAIVVASALLVAMAGARADSVADFYRGKTINVVIGYSPGGGYDTYARLVARFIGRYIPGNPTLQPQQMAGGGSRIAAGYMANVAPRDGTMIATADQSLAVQQAVGDPTILFDASKFNWIGNPTADNNTLAVASALGVKTIADARTREIVIGATGINTSSQYAQALNTVAGTKFKIVLGYPGAMEMGLALERGEIGGYTNTWAGWVAEKPDWLRDKKITILVQIGLERMKEMPDVPLLMEVADDDLDRAAFRLWSAAAAFGRPLFTTPGVPPERVAALRAAFDKTMKDPDFLAAAAKSGFDIDPVPGAELQRLAEDIVTAPKAVTERLSAIIALPQQQKVK
jgi:tripartite-type tricarboxylate transporter receptor subunit TctC